MANNYIIAEDYVLPSKGRVYRQKVNPNIKLRSMTTEHEMRRLSHSDRAYKNLCEIIDDCLVENPGISAYDMCLADYQFLLHRLRVVTYGSSYRIEFRCPYCKTTNLETVNLDDLQVNYLEDDISDLLEFTLPKSNKKIRICMQTPRMIDDVQVQSKERNRKSKSGSDSAFLFTLMNLIETIDGEEFDVIQKERFVRELDMMDTNYIMKKAQKLVESFGIDTKIERQCSLCGLDYTGSFRITSEFFGPGID